MIYRIVSAATHGIIGQLINIEIDISRGLPAMNVVGMADTTVKESKERIRSAILNSGLSYPKGRITVNMAPAYMKKRGSHFDLAIAVGMLVASQQVFDGSMGESGFIGELSLDGRVNRVNGILPMVMAMSEQGMRHIYLPADNIEEAALVKSVNVYPVRNLRELADSLNLEKKIVPFLSKLDHSTMAIACEESQYDIDFSDVRGQESAKRGIMVAAAGNHGLLMKGSPSTGKTMLSERIPTILPPMNYREIIETTVIYSVSGQLSDGFPLVYHRPFRQPHHSITAAGLIGGGIVPKPGEITLANKGVLFLDEFGEYEKNTIEKLRQPLESKKIKIIRGNETYIFPADFMLVAATNPCRCGYYGDPMHECNCKPYEIERYNQRISGPILDRIDMHMNLTPVAYQQLKQKEGMSSAEMRCRIEEARKIQEQRFKNMRIACNSEIDDHLAEKFCQLDDECEEIIKMAYDRLKLNPRTLLKIKRVARTISDLDGSENIKTSHLTEAIHYREVLKYSR